jgi:hypothetical protein
VRIDGAFEKGLIYDQSSSFDLRRRICFDETIFCETVLGDLSGSQQRQNCVIELMQDILWAFNMQPDSENLKEFIQKIFARNGLC